MCRGICRGACHDKGGQEEIKKKGEKSGDGGKRARERETLASRLRKIASGSTASVFHRLFFFGSPGGASLLLAKSVSLLQFEQEFSSPLLLLLLFFSLSENLMLFYLIYRGGFGLINCV